jgi:hypothetical protein
MAGLMGLRIYWIQHGSGLVVAEWMWGERYWTDLGNLTEGRRAFLVFPPSSPTEGDEGGAPGLFGFVELFEAAAVF